MPRSRLANVPTVALKEELRRRLAALPKLLAQRDELNRQIAELEALGAKAKAPSLKKAGAPKKAARRAKRAKNRMTLPDALAEALKGKESMSIPEATEAVQAAGYKSTSKNFGQVVAQTLSNDKRFKRLSRGKYALKG